MKEKKDIFNGKIKKEYFSYILIYMIFIALLMLVVGGMVLYVGLWANAGPMPAIIFMRVLGVIIIALGIAYVVGCMLVIRKYPKYEKLRHILYNSDCYFTESDSNEYYGRIRGIRGRRYKAAFDLVTYVTALEAGMGNKQPIQYKVYNILSILMSVLGLTSLIAMPLLVVNDAIQPKMQRDTFCFCCMAVGIVCVFFAIFFFLRAMEIAEKARVEKVGWESDLYMSLVDISVRQNNKKHKFWYDKDQLEQIENLVKSASKNAELKLETKGNKIISFTVVDTLNNSVRFTGLFI